MAFSAISIFHVAFLLLAQAPPRQDLTGYRTVQDAVTAKIVPAPASAVGLAGYLGVATVRDAQKRLVIEDVQADSPGARAGLRTGDVITHVEKHPVSTPQALREWLQAFPPGATVTLKLQREGKALELKATLVATSRPMSLSAAKTRFRNAAPPALWQKPVFRLAVIPVEFSDVKHNAKITRDAWKQALFGQGMSGNEASGAGARAAGSLNDYFREQSAGVFHLEGKVFEWLNVGKKRGDYIQGSGTTNKTAVLTEALQKLLARDGKDALKGFDGFLFLYAGDRYRTNRGAVYYPHAGGLLHQGQRVPYLITNEGGPRMTPVNGFVKLVGLALGLPDLAARPEDSGSQGLGPWCALSDPNTEGRPQHFGAWAKEKLGWLKPAVLDPSVKQKLILALVTTSPRECFKILVRADSSEYYLLENRTRQGFDADLPGAGLLIWRVVNGRPTLCAAHGIEGPSAPLLHLRAVPYPSPANHAFTPETTPSSRSPVGGGQPVHLTDIRRLEDGRIVFSIGYEYR
jgi:M6 family metalloprotease-like protein